MLKNKLYSGCSILMVILLFQSRLANAQIVGTNAYIKASNVEVGIAGAGGFEGVPTASSPPLTGMHPRSATGFFGFVANPHLDSWATFDGDFFTPGTPENGWGIEIGTSGGPSGSNNCDFQNDINGSITSWQHIFDCYTSDWEGNMTTGGTNLHIKINYFLQETDLFYTTTVSITNNTSAVIPDMYYYRNVDPDNDEELSGDFTTQNTIVSQPGTGCNVAHVKGTQSTPWDSYLGFAAVGPNWRADFGGFSNRDASDLWNGIGFTQAVGATDFMDEAISLAYRIQGLAPGATETFKFVVILDDASASNAINNLLYLTYPGSVGAPPAVCTPYADTVRTCGGPVPVQVSGSNVGDFTWSWTPTAGLSPATGPNVTANPAVTTTYTAHGTPISSCVGPIDLTFVVQVTPSTGANPVITNIPPVCISDPPFNLTADSTGGTWYGTGITNASAGTFNPATAGVGSYTITYITPGTCNTTDTAIVTVSNILNPTITDPPSVCISGSPITISAATGGGTWSGPGITSATAGTFDPSTVAGPGTYTVTYSIPGACGAVDSTTVTVTALFDATITPHVNVCAGSAAFNLTAATPGGTWSGSGITDPVAGTFTPTTAGTQVVTYTISGSCGNTDTVHINVITPANATISPVPSSVCASAPPFNFSAVTPGGTWSGTGITSSSAGTFNPSVSGAGTFTITYAVPGLCGDTATRTIIVHANPTPNFTSNITSGCVPLCINFSEAVGTSCDSVNYNFGDGTGVSTLSPSHCFNNPGSYSVTIFCKDGNNCAGTTTISNMITVSPIPVANFTISPSTTVAPNTAVNFTNTSTGATSSTWTFGDTLSIDNVSLLTSPTHTYAHEGEYCVSLVAENAGGCMDTARYCLVVIGEATIVIPNVFTPNGDGINEFFWFDTKGVESLKCTIYDRWGLKIAEVSGIGEADGWNGETKGGRPAPDGTYYYIMEATAINHKAIKQEGFIQLIREK